MTGERIRTTLFDEAAAGSHRHILVELSEPGLTLDAADSGATPEARFGRDCEFGIAVATADRPRFADQRIVKHDAGRSGAVGEIRALAEQPGIRTNCSNWQRAVF
jgi:hypothetical protein